MTINIMRKALVCYFDIFGFSDLIRQASQKEIENYFVSLTGLWNWLKKEGIERKYNVYLFSDCGFITFPLRSNYSFDELRDSTRQFLAFINIVYDYFLEKDFFLRGGISFGNILEQENLLIGEPVLESVNIEKYYCPGPMIIFPAYIQKKLIRHYQEQEVKYTENFLPLYPIRLKDGGLINCSIMISNNRKIFLDLINSKRDYYLNSSNPKYATLWDDFIKIIREIYQ